METENINRAYLETLSFSDLSKLADEYGVDVPEDLDRRFLICELLDIVEESKLFNEDMVISSDRSSEENTVLPQGYNETQISCVLRNPVWAFVFWNISNSDNNKLKEMHDCTLMLRVCSLPSQEELTPKESFEIKITAGSQEQYVLIPAGEKYIRIELVYISGATRNVLAFSPVIEIPQGSESLNNIQPGKQNDYPEIIKLSGIEKILLNQYKNHRHSFSG
ncbi:MAG: DUF4912 domain-containing protein [Treponema sp.]|nr:DUF4912 domain-containing protein [Treponema sp.]